MYLKDSYYAARYSLMDNLSTFTIFNIFESFEIGFFRDKKKEYPVLARIFEKEGSKERIVRFRNPISNSELSCLLQFIFGKIFKRLPRVASKPNHSNLLHAEERNVSSRFLASGVQEYFSR